MFKVIIQNGCFVSSQTATLVVVQGALTQRSELDKINTLFCIVTE